MALTRAFLKGLSLADEQVSAIIEQHAETVDGLKAYKADAEKLAEVQKELNELKAKGDGGYKEKYEAEHSAFESYKTEVESRETRRTKETAYAKLLEEAGIPEKARANVLRLSNLDEVKVGTDGKIDGAENIVSSLKTEWAGIIPRVTPLGSGVQTPPNNTGGGTNDDALTDAEFFSKYYSANK